MNLSSILHVPPRSLEGVQRPADQTSGYVQGIEQEAHGQGQGCGDARLGEQVAVCSLPYAQFA